MKDIFHISKLLIKEKLNILTDLEKIELKKLKDKHQFSKDIKFDDLIDNVTSYSKINKEKAWNAIEHKTKKTQNKSTYQLFNKKWYKYAAAAVFIGVLISAYFFKHLDLNQVTNNKHNTVIVNTIKPGTDKATLTLENGSQITLEKGTSLNISNAKSNGEQIIYNSGHKKTKKTTYNYLTIPRGGQFHIILSDGTRVWLNSETQIKYPTSFIEGETRKVELVYGEAYFDVTPSTENKGSKFIVLNNHQNIEVVGTEFNIKAYKDEKHIYTTLVEGKVIVDSKGKTQNLIPSEQSVLSLLNNNISVSKVDVKSETSWKNGIFSFKGKSLKDIMKVISRWYNVDVVFKNKELEEITFKGVLGKKQNLKQILETIKTLSVIKNYKINEKTITLE